MSFFEALSTSFQAHPGTPFLIEPGGPVITHAAALHRAGQLAAALAAQGIAPGDRLAVKVEKSPGAILLYLACLHARIVYVPINPASAPPKPRTSSPTPPPPP